MPQKKEKDKAMRGRGRARQQQKSESGRGQASTQLSPSSKVSGSPFFFSPPTGLKVKRSDNECCAKDSLNGDFLFMSVTSSETGADDAAVASADASFASADATHIATCSPSKSSAVGEHTAEGLDLVHILQGAEAEERQDTGTVDEMECQLCSTKFPVLLSSKCRTCPRGLCPSCMHNLKGEKPRHDMAVLLKTKGGTLLPTVGGPTCIACYRVGESECCCDDGGTAPSPLAKPESVVFFGAPARWQNRKHGRELGQWDYCPDCNVLRCPSCGPQGIKKEHDYIDEDGIEYGDNYEEISGYSRYPGCLCTNQKFGGCFCDRKLAENPLPFWVNSGNAHARQHTLTIPEGFEPGDTFIFNVPGSCEVAEVMVPRGKCAGDDIDFTVEPCLRKDDPSKGWSQGFWRLREEHLHPVDFLECEDCGKVLCDECAFPQCCANIKTMSWPDREPGNIHTGQRCRDCANSRHGDAVLERYVVSRAHYIVQELQGLCRYGMVDPEDVAEELSAAKNGWRFCNQRTEFPADVSSPSVLPQAWLLRHPILTHLRAVENGANPTWDPQVDFSKSIVRC